MDIAVVRQRKTSVIHTVQKTAEVPQSRQLDRVVDVADERSDHDSGATSRVRSQVTLRSSMATLTIPRTQLPSPSFLLENTQVCVETDVNRPEERGQPVMEGTQQRSVQ